MTDIKDTNILLSIAFAFAMVALICMVASVVVACAANTKASI